MGVEIKAVYRGQLKVQATHGPSGSQLITEAPADNGGTGGAFSPTDLVGTALGSCILTILGLVAQRHDVDLTGTEVRVTKEMIQQPIRRIGRLETLVQLPATVPAELRERLEAAAGKCPVHKSLHPDIEAPITFTYVEAIG